MYFKNVLAFNFLIKSFSKSLLLQLSSFVIFIYEQWKKSYMYCLIIKASWEDLATVVFVTDKFVFLCTVICLVIARKRFLPQPDCSVITKVHDFSLLLYTVYLFSKDKQTLKTEDTLYKFDFSSATQTNLWSFSSWMSEVFILRQTSQPFQRLGLHCLRSIFTAFAVGLSG